MKISGDSKYIVNKVASVAKFAVDGDGIKQDKKLLDKTNAASKEMAEAAADKLIACIRSAIERKIGDNHEAGDLGLEVAGELGELDTYIADARDGVCRAYIYHMMDVMNYGRPSLYEEGYPGGIDNIVEYLNNGTDGYSAGQVYGEWHGDRIRGLRSRRGAHFAEQGVADFKGNYAGDYNVRNVEIIFNHN